jgi:hypothetical protein
VFTIRGVTDGGREGEHSIAWYPLGRDRVRARPKNRRGLVGDEELIRRAIADELDGRSFAATATGPFYRADLDDPAATRVQLSSYFRPGYRVDGDVPALAIEPLPEGAIP